MLRVLGGLGGKCQPDMACWIAATTEESEASSAKTAGLNLWSSSTCVVFVCCCWVGIVVPKGMRIRSSLKLFSLLWMSFLISLISFGWTSWLSRGGPAMLSNSGLTLSRGGQEKIPSAMVLLLAFIYMCLSAVARASELAHKHHEARALWHCFDFLGCLSLSPVDFIWAGWLLRGGPFSLS